MPLDQEYPALGSVYSVALTMDQFDQNAAGKVFLTSFVGKCGAKRAEGCAIALVAEVDTIVEEHRQKIIKSVERLQRNR